MLIHGPLVRRAIDFGIDFSNHENSFINREIGTGWPGVICRCEVGSRTRWMSSPSTPL